MSPPPQKRQRRNAIRPNSNEWQRLAEFGTTFALERMGVSAAEGVVDSDNVQSSAADGSSVRENIAADEEKPEDDEKAGEAATTDRGEVDENGCDDDSIESSITGSEESSNEESDVEGNGGDTGEDEKEDRQE